MERLESLIRSQPKFARAWGALAAGYLSLGGEDESSLTQLAENSAEHALTLDEEIADAHAALGLAHLRRNEWVAAREQFERALTLDAQTGAALEGLACLLVDAGRYKEAAPFAAQAVAIQPQSIGANECFSYTLTTTPAPPSIQATPSPVRALEAMLAGDNSSARRNIAWRAEHSGFQSLGRATCCCREQSPSHSPGIAGGDARGERAADRSVDRNSLWHGAETARVRFQPHVPIAAPRRTAATASAVDAADKVLAPASALRASRERCGPSRVLAVSKALRMCAPPEPQLYGCKMHSSSAAKPDRPALTVRPTDSSKSLITCW